MKNPLKPDPNFEVHNEELEEAMKQLAAFIDQQLPDGVHFGLFLFSGKATFYTSNVERQSLIDMLKKWIGKRDKKPPIIQT